MNKIVVDAGNLKVNSQEIVQSMTPASQMRLDKSHNSSWIRLAKFHNPIVPKTNSGMGSNVKLICKLAKSLIKTSSKVYKPKTYDEAINNPIYRNKWYKVIDKEL